MAGTVNLPFTPEQFLERSANARTFAKVEIMGHDCFIGLVSKSDEFGPVLTRVDVINADGKIVATQHYGAAAIFRITPLDQATAMLLAAEGNSVMGIPWSVRDAIEAEIRAGWLKSEFKQASRDELLLIANEIDAEVLRRKKIEGAEVMVGEFDDDGEPF